MTGEGREAATREEVDRAREEIRAADQLLAIGIPRVALTRAYFACFHAVRARLYAEGLEPRTHQGALHLFNLHFIKPGRFPVDCSRLLARLQKFREEADYGDSFVIDSDGAREEIDAARGFVARVEADLGASPV